MFDKIFIICYNSLVPNITSNIRTNITRDMEGGDTMEQTPLSFLREASQQRSISLYRDQEQKIKEFSEKLGKKLGYTDIIREGVDIVLAKLAEQVPSK